MAGFEGAIDMRRELGLAAEMQPDAGGIFLRGRSMVLRQIVDEGDPARGVFLHDPLDRRALGPLIGVDLDIEPVPGQLLAARLGPVIEQVRQDHHIGLVRQAAHGLDRARNRHLPVHLGIEERTEQAPDLFLADHIPAAAITQGVGKIVLELEVDIVLAGEPFAKRRDHVEQDFVAIADDEGSL